MSTDYYFLRGIPKTDILEKTDIEIVSHPDPNNNKKFLKDKYGNILHIIDQYVTNEGQTEPYLDTEEIHELTRYSLNNATYIMDTLVREFKLIYFSDNGFQNLYRPAEESHDPNIVSNVKNDMLDTHGYVVNDLSIGDVIIPERTEEDYFKPNPPQNDN